MTEFKLNEAELEAAFQRRIRFINCSGSFTFAWLKLHP
jgi:hypothetical protein